MIKLVHIPLNIHSKPIFIVDLQATTLALDFRVSVLEENGGDDGNSSVAELEVRVETLEGTADDHETRISTAESDIIGNFKKLIMKCFFDKQLPTDKHLILHFCTIVSDLEDVTTNLETRLTGAEENIQGLYFTS